MPASDTVPQVAREARADPSSTRGSGAGAAELRPDYVLARGRPWGRLAELAVFLVLLGIALNAGVSSGVVVPSVIGQFLISPRLLGAVGNTLYLATFGTVVAIVLGTVLALMRVSRDPVVSGISALYVFVFRGTPMLIQLLFWFNAVPVVVRVLHIEIPLSGFVLLHEPSINVITPFVAALLGLALAETAYMCEVIRSGMLGVDRGQRDAARALGLTELTVQLRIVVPQAFRIVLPALGNEYVSMLKNTSLAYAIGYLEILRVTSDIYSVNFRVMELLVVAAAWYLVLTAVVSLLEQYAERRLPAR